MDTVFLRNCVLLIGLLFFNVVQAESQSILQNIQFEAVSSREIHLKLHFSKPPLHPESFALEDPATIVFDFKNTLVGLAIEQENQSFQSMLLNALSVVQTDEKTRVVLNVEKMLPYSTQIQDTVLSIKLKDQVESEVSQATTQQITQAADSQETLGLPRIEALDFKRGSNGEGLLVLKLSDPAVSVDFKEEYERIWVHFLKTKVQDHLIRRFNVLDFGTPVEAISVQEDLETVFMEIEARGEYEKIAYQVDEEFIVEIRPISEQEKQAKLSEQFKYTGERLSFNARSMDVREALRQLADFTGLNMVISDSISGTLTLRLQNVPWDQALDIILKSKGLSKKQEENVILVGSAEEMATRDQLALEASRQRQALDPIRSEMIQINYAQAKTFVEMFKEEGSSFLSARGKVSVDERTNMLLVQDTDENIQEIEKLIKTLDVPIKQVMIEAQIVESSDNLTDALGVRFGGAGKISAGSRTIGIAGSPITTDGDTTNPTGGLADIGAVTPAGVQAANIAGTGSAPSSSHRGLFFDGAQVSGIGRLGLSIARLPGGTLLDLELQAIESETKGKILARPRLMTLDKQTAILEAGREIPYQATPGANSAGTTEFKEALTKLEVTPQITPDNKILMKIVVTKDSPVDITSTTPIINKKKLETNVLIDNGQTIVLGGLFEIDKSTVKRKVPFLGDLPLIGRLFQSKSSRNDRTETLIFITPKIVREG